MAQLARLSYSRPSPRFVAGLQANLHYWLGKTEPLNDETVNQLEPDFPNLLKTVELGLVLPETWVVTGRVMAACFFWVEGAGHAHLWQPLLSQLVAQLPESELSLRFQLLKQLGQFQQLQNQPELALNTFQQALTLAHHLHNPFALADIYINQAKIYQLQGQYEQAERLAQVVLELVNNRDTKLWAVTMETLGYLAQEQGRLAPAGDYLRQAISLHRQTAITINLARASKALATLLLAQQQPDEALCLLQQTETLLQNTSYRKDQIELFINKGTVYYNLERLDEAETNFQQAGQLAHRQSGFSLLKGVIANNLGCIWRDKQHWGTAENFYYQAIALYQLAGNQLLTANAFGNLAKLYLRQGKVAPAGDYFGKALSLLAQFPYNRWANQLKQEYETAWNQA